MEQNVLPRRRICCEWIWLVTSPQLLSRHTESLMVTLLHSWSNGPTRRAPAERSACAPCCGEGGGVRGCRSHRPGRARPQFGCVRQSRDPPCCRSLLRLKQPSRLPPKKGRVASCYPRPVLQRPTRAARGASGPPQTAIHYANSLKLAVLSVTKTILWRGISKYLRRGRKMRSPADLPVAQPANFKFVIINPKTAKTLGLTTPPS